MRVDTAWEIVNGEEKFFLCPLCEDKEMERVRFAKHLIEDHTEREAAKIL